MKVKVPLWFAVNCTETGTVCPEVYFLTKVPVANLDYFTG